MGRLSLRTGTRDNRAVATSPPSDNVHLLVRMYEVWDAHDLDAVLELLDPEFA
jgi:hypothetical protein